MVVYPRFFLFTRDEIFFIKIRYPRFVARITLTGMQPRVQPSRRNKESRGQFKKSKKKKKEIVFEPDFEQFA